MKISLKIVSAAAAFALGLLSGLHAQDCPPPPPPDGCPGGFCKDPQAGFLKMLTEKLSLTQEQQTKIKAILTDEKQAMDALRDDTSIDREAGHEKMEAIIKTHREQIRVLLTPEQQKIFAQIKPHDRHGPPPPDGPGPDEN